MSNNTKEFVLRLNEIFDDKGLPNRGRQAFLSKQFDVSQPSAKKWLDGNNYPEMSKIVDIAKWGNVSVEWLLTGRGVKKPIELNFSPELLKITELLNNSTHEQQQMVLGVIEIFLQKRK